MVPPAPLLSLADIATLARVKRPVPSNWRRRYDDFPPAVETDGNRTWFDGHDVVDWLASNGLGNTPSEELLAELSAHGLARLASEIGGQCLVDALGALLCLHYLDEKELAGASAAALCSRAERMDPDDEFLRSELTSHPKLAARLAPVAEELIEAAFTVRGAHEHLMAQRHRLGLTGPDTGALAEELRRLTVQVADSQARADAHDDTFIVGDPHAHCGDLLHDVVSSLDEPDRVRVLGADHRPALARLTRRRMLLAGIDEVELDVQTGAELEEELGNPDVVVSLLPYRAGESRSATDVLYAVEAIADRLAPGTGAVIIGPADALVGDLDGEAAAVRWKLLSNNIVESVTALPAGADPYRPLYGCAVWTLAREPVRAARGRVLISDVSTHSLDANVRAALAEDILLWRAYGYALPGSGSGRSGTRSAGHSGHDPRYGQAVSLQELQKRRGAALRPPGPPAARRISRTARELPALVGEVQTRLEVAEQRAVSRLDTAGPLHLDLIRRDRVAARITLGELIAQGHIEQVKGIRLDATTVEDAGFYPVLGSDEVLRRAPIGGRRIDSPVFADKYPKAPTTRAGDVVYVSGAEFGVHVDHAGASVVAFPARVLRISRKGSETLTPRVLGLLLEGAAASRDQNGSARSTRSVGALALPVLTETEVRRLDAALVRAEERSALLDAQRAELDTLRRLAAEGLTDGTVTVSRT